ncbi:hypothetical protein [Aquimarina mytili]|uniref:Uncharacterized protein n=1 Tax=Aquimarina mytili TaxID=874423 RepID=A0A937D755_9FLAO|nr:hypothetical protein [Aquimarina mytili]MBL0682750.1 hypothetical protein [Aquimarina mytili]
MTKVQKNKLKTKLGILCILLGATLSIWAGYRFSIDVYLATANTSIPADTFVYAPIIFFLGLGLIIIGILELNGSNKRNEKLVQQKEEEKWERLKDLDKLFKTKVNSSKRKK